jgi:hypothetical protein
MSKRPLIFGVWRARQAPCRARPSQLLARACILISSPPGLARPQRGGGRAGAWLRNVGPTAGQHGEESLVHPLGDEGDRPAFQQRPGKDDLSLARRAMSARGKADLERLTRHSQALQGPVRGAPATGCPAAPVRLMPSAARAASHAAARSRASCRPGRTGQIQDLRRAAANRDIGHTPKGIVSTRVRIYFRGGAVRGARHAGLGAARVCSSGRIRVRTAAVTGRISTHALTVTRSAEGRRQRDLAAGFRIDQVPPLPGYVHLA